MYMKGLPGLYGSVFITIALVLLYSPSLPGAQKQTGTAAGYIQSQETNIAGVVAELTECKRKEGVLTVKVRFRNVSNNKVWLSIDTHHGSYDGFYVTAEKKKYFVLRDSDGDQLAPKYLGGVHLQKNETHAWWAKFPAPPAGVKSINLMIPQVLPFEDVPITDQ